MKVADAEIIRLKLDREVEVGDGSLRLTAGDVKLAEFDPGRRIVRTSSDQVVECGLSLVPQSTFHQTTTAGPRVDTERDGIEPRSGRRFRRPSPLLQLHTAHSPALVVEHPNRALPRVQRQPGEDFNPDGNSLQVVG